MRTTTNPEAGAEPLSTSFEACARFSAPVDGSPVCDACGWLAHEHDHGIAEVRALPSPPRVRPRPKRLAS